MHLKAAEVFCGRKTRSGIFRPSSRHARFVHAEPRAVAAKAGISDVDLAPVVPENGMLGCTDPASPLIQPLFEITNGWPGWLKFAPNNPEILDCVATFRYCLAACCCRAG